MREASTSITQLVKTVAKEVFDKEHKKAHLPIDDVSRCGDLWSQEEDELLNNEWKVFLTKTAYLHKRTKVAINTRLFQKVLY